MTVTAIEHVLILSHDIETTREFYCDVVGLRVGPRPALEFPGYWLYADGPNACLHVAESEPYLEHAAALGLAAATGQRAGGGAIDPACHAHVIDERPVVELRATGRCD